MILNACKHLLIHVFLSFVAAVAWAQSLPDGGMFDLDAAAKGIIISRSVCANFERQNTAVWVTVDKTGYCIRYYAAGLDGHRNSIAALWLHGDIMGAHEAPPTRHLKGLGVDALIDQQKRLSDRFAVPFLFLGRPGSYGSAGRHFTMRERQIEADIVDRAIDALKAKYGIEAWAFGGHSGGGVLVAEMLNHRRDIRCAIISSAPGAFRDYLAAHHSSRTNSPDMLNPILATASIPQQADKRIFVIADPRDRNVKFFLNRPYVDALKQRGLSVRFLAFDKALAPEFHDLIDIAQTATGMCAAGRPTDDIITTLDAMPTQRFRQVN